MLVPTGSKYADQKQVYQRIGSNILDNAWEGYHCCFFAYGQTGSGKSYSMIGYGVNKGTVPITCNQIFNRIKYKSERIQYQVHENRNKLISKSNKKVFLKPLSSNAHLYVNGKNVDGTIELMNLDRVLFVWNSVYLFLNKKNKRQNKLIKNRMLAYMRFLQR